MLSAFKYRLYPKPEQETRLNRSLLSLCDLYNELKAEEMRRYREEHRSTSRTTFRALALGARKHDERLQDTHSQVVQNVGDRIHRSFRNFFEGRARFPNWKKPHRYNSLTFPQSGFRLDSEKGLLLFGLGYVRIFVHRPLLGRVRRLTVKREADGEWYAVFITEREGSVRSPLAEIPANRIRGADMGLSRFVTFDDAASTEYPEFLRRSEDKIRYMQRHFNRKHKGSRRRRELGRRIARLHLHVKRQREDFQNKLVHKIFAENDVLVLEKLNVSGMLHNHTPRQIHLGRFLEQRSPAGLCSRPIRWASIPSSSTRGEPRSSATTAWDGSRRTWQRGSTSVPTAASRFRETRTPLS